MYLYDIPLICQIAEVSLIDTKHFKKSILDLEIIHLKHYVCQRSCASVVQHLLFMHNVPGSILSPFSKEAQVVGDMEDLDLTPWEWLQLKLGNNGPDVILRQPHVSVSSKLDRH